MDRPFFDAIAAAALRLPAEDFEEQGLSNTVWAFATVAVNHTRLMRALAMPSSDTIRSFKTQGLANTAWAFAAIRFE